MGDRQYQIERTQHDHKENHETDSIGPCNLLQEVHDTRMDEQIRSRKGDRVDTTTNDKHNQVRVVGAIPVFDSKEQIVIVDHAWNKHMQAQDGRDIVEQHHDRERNEHKKDKVLFGLFSGDHKERNITHDVLIDGKLSHYTENSHESTVKFLGITIAHSQHRDNDDEDAKPRHVNPPPRYGKWR